MKLGYYPGCSLHATGREFSESMNAIAKPLAIDMQELTDWSCCGSTAGHNTNHLLSVALSARNLALAEEQGYDRVFAPCAACFSRLATARHQMAHDAEVAAQVRGMMPRDFKNTVDVVNVLALLKGLTGEIKAKAQPLTGMKVACYYGCLLVRPPEIAAFDDAESPTSMEEIVTATGATPVKWNRRLDCCGGGFSLSRTGSVIRLGRSILEDAKRAGAEAVVVGCPMCHSNLDLRQKAMAQNGQELDLPVLYITQLVGLALGLPREELGLNRHFVSTDKLVASKAAPVTAPATH